MSIADQIKCKHHPSEYITNYCAKDTCYIQLCATCICEHTQFHNRTHTKPQYQNIKETFLKTNESLNKFKQSLTKQKSRIKNILDGIQKKRKEVQKLFKQAKQDVMTIVQRTFSDLQRDFNDQLNKQKQKTGLLNQAKLDQIYAQINKRSLQTYTVSQELNNLRQTNNIKKINTQFLPKGNMFKDQVSQQITQNQLFQPTVIYKSSYLQQVAGALKRLICITFSYPVANQNRQHRPTISNKTPNKVQQAFNQTQTHGQCGMQAGTIQYNQTNGAPNIFFGTHSIHHKQNASFMRNTQQIRSPSKAQIQGRPSNMRSTTKQNCWVKNQPVIKVFSNTLSY